MFAPIDWIKRCTYCLPVMPIVTTRISEAVPMTMPRAVRAKRTLLLMKVSYAKLITSFSRIVLRRKGGPIWLRKGWRVGGRHSGAEVGVVGVVAILFVRCYSLGRVAD